MSLEKAKVLLVGTGGIGCEVLKNLAMAGCKEIHCVDLDTIELSNLNRQFLFRKKDIGRSKAITAVESVKQWAIEGTLIEAYFCDIKDKKIFSLEFFNSFDVVLNALDNIALRIPLVESGTAGYLGQVSCHVRGISECFDCQPKPQKKTYPVCTIRNTPTEMIHCVIWAKEYIFPKIFHPMPPDSSEEENAVILKDKNSHEIFNELFDSSIKKLQSMKELWESRTPPCFISIENDRVLCANENFEISEKSSNILVQNCHFYLESSKKLFKRALNGMLIFDKEDDDIVEFISSLSNIRAFCFGIPFEDKFLIQEKAGSIIPAIATTNAIISGLVILKAQNLLSKNYEKCSTVFLSKIPCRNQILSSESIVAPNPDCVVCSRNVYFARFCFKTLSLLTFMNAVTLSIFSKHFDEEDEISVSAGARILYDFDFQSNLNRNFEEILKPEDYFLTMSIDDKCFYVALLESKDKIRIDTFIDAHKKRKLLD